MSFHDLNIPASSSTVTVKIFDVIEDNQKVIAAAANFLTPVAPGYENLACPIFAFLVENTSTKQRVMFDLGARKDLENAAPSVAAAFKAGHMALPISKDIVEQLAEDGIELESISAVIWRCFPSSTDLVFGKDSHQSGHVCALARYPTSFVFLGADTCHHPGVFRPTSKLHKHIPCPGELLAATRFSVSHSHIHKPGPEFKGAEFDLSSRTTPLLSIAEKGYFEDPPTANDSIRKMGDFDANADVFVSVIGRLPVSLDQWQVNGWKKEATWAFVDEKVPHLGLTG
ncbi:hypothetical protein B0H13DRAFT_2011652 [Mycena leptocephala]|nr:hypothetical protein B0H13DRAFT_2011652 [Mycena leptocephala]